MPLRNRTSGAHDGRLGRRFAPRRAAITAAVFCAACFALPGGRRAHGDEPTPAQTIANAAQQMDRASPEYLFTVARELDAMGPAGLGAAKEALATAGPRSKIGLARYLLTQNERTLALETLRALVVDADTTAATLAAEMLEQHAQSRADVASLADVLDKVRDPSVKIAVAKTLRAKARDTSAERVLKEYLASDSFDTRAKAALALGDVGNVEAAKAVLDVLAAEPTERGKRARGLLYQEKLFESLRKTQGLDEQGQTKLLEEKVKELEEKLKAAQNAPAAKGGGDLALLNELVDKIKTFYVDGGEKIADKALLDSAAKGLVSSLDPFSSYMTEKETEDFDQGMRGKYAGIGAVVSVDPKDKMLTIIRPIYSGPAYRVGLRSLDKITQVEGQSTFGKTVEELVSQLKGDDGTEVKVKVYRKGWTKERDFTLKREIIELKSVHHEMLPGQIGYLQLSQFGQQAVDEVEAALQDLEKNGMRALIFDLRANPGGLLSGAVDIADKFLKDNKLIVYSEGRNPHLAPRREYRTRQAATHPDYPVVVLINRASASASEIVSGALQDHGRATLVGETTFGKGSVQQLMKVTTTGGKSTLRLTIAKYYLPSGRSIHRDAETGEGGVKPDIEVASETRSAWEIDETDNFLGTGAVERYVEGLWKDHKDVVKQLARFDDHDPTKYAGFEAFYAEAKTPLSKELVRLLVRNQVRRLAQDDEGREFPTDLQEDRQLQRSILEALTKVGDDPANFVEYRSFKEKFAKAEAPAKVEAPR